MGGHALTYKIELVRGVQEHEEGRIPALLALTNKCAILRGKAQARVER